MENMLVIEKTEDGFYFNGYVKEEEMVIDFYSDNVEDGMELLEEYEFDAVLEK